MPIMLPIATHRFKLTNCDPQITQNVVDAKFNFAEKTLEVTLRLTVESDSFQAAMDLANAPRFAVDMMGGNNDPYYRLVPQDLKLVDHQLSFSYAVAGSATNVYKWTYSDISIMAPKNEIKPIPPVEGFMNLDEAIESLRQDAGC